MSEYRTLAGFVLTRLGRISVIGDSVECEVGGAVWCFGVTQMKGRRIDEVSMRKVAQ